MSIHSNPFLIAVTGKQYNGKKRKEYPDFRPVCFFFFSVGYPSKSVNLLTTKFSLFFLHFYWQQNLIYSRRWGNRIIYCSRNFFLGIFTSLRTYIIVEPFFFFHYLNYSTLWVFFHITINLKPFKYIECVGLRRRIVRINNLKFVILSFYFFWASLLFFFCKLSFMIENPKRGVIYVHIEIPLWRRVKRMVIKTDKPSEKRTGCSLNTSKAVVILFQWIFPVDSSLVVMVYYQKNGV